MWGKFLSTGARLLQPSVRPLAPQQPMSILRMYFPLTKANKLAGYATGGGSLKHNPDKSARVPIKMRARRVVEERREQPKPAIAFVPGYSS